MRRRQGVLLPQHSCKLERTCPGVVAQLDGEILESSFLGIYFGIGSISCVRIATKRSKWSAPRKHLCREGRLDFGADAGAPWLYGAGPFLA